MFSFSLDESERPLEGRPAPKFRFRGILKIADPGWLSDFGLKTIEAELNLRAKERALRLGEGERRTHQLTLESLFENRLLTRSNDATWRGEDETRLTVLIQGEKNLPANFMHGTCHRWLIGFTHVLMFCIASRLPNGLLWSSKDQ